MSADAILARLEKKVMAEHLMPIALEIQSGARQNLSGEVLNVQTGTLREAVQIAITGPLEVQVGVVGSPNPVSGVKASEYGKHLERGTRLMPAKPFMRPAVDAMRVKYRRA